MPQDHLPMVQREGSRQSRGIYLCGSFAGQLFFSDVNKQSHDAPSRHSWRLTFFCYSLICIGIAALWWFLGKEAPLSRPGETAGMGQTFKKLGKVRNVQILLAMGLLSFATIHGIGHWLPKIMEASGMSPEKAGFIAAIPLRRVFHLSDPSWDHPARPEGSIHCPGLFSHHVDTHRNCGDLWNGPTGSTDPLRHPPIVLHIYSHPDSHGYTRG